MDSLTHALAGAAVGVLLVRSRSPQQTMSKRLLPALFAGVIAATAPDLDYLLFPLDPSRFLAHWHRGPSHSLLLLPLWAWLLTCLLRRFSMWRPPALPLLGICALALLSHLLLDWLNSYGIGLLSPLVDDRPALHWTFELDPLLSLGIALLLVASCLPRWRLASTAAAVALMLYLVQLRQWQHEALALATRYRDQQGWSQASVHAFPQPLISSHRHLVVATEAQYCHSYQALSQFSLRPLFGRDNAIAAMLQHYQPSAAAHWHCYSPFASTDAKAAEIQDRWQDPRLADFRAFATLPMLDQVSATASERCLWFSDLRYNWPVLPATFRYGFCRSTDSKVWQPYRLRYLRAHARDAL
ncbi:MAG: metal-dependent hydrolase [Pseudomonadota bacterium]